MPQDRWTWTDQELSFAEAEALLKRAQGTMKKLITHFNLLANWWSNVATLLGDIKSHTVTSGVPASSTSLEVKEQCNYIARIYAKYTSEVRKLRDFYLHHPADGNHSGRDH